MVRNCRIRLAFALLLTVPTWFLGCATAAPNADMVVGKMPDIRKKPFSVYVIAQGGSEEGVSDSYSISNPDLAKAIGESIANSGLFVSVASSPGAAYELRATLVELSRPILGPTFTVTTEIAWDLSRAPSGETYMRRSFTSSSTVSMGEAPVGTTRRRLAMERAIRENIRNALAEIGTLELR